MNKESSIIVSQDFYGKDLREGDEFWYIDVEGSFEIQGPERISMWELGCKAWWTPLVFSDPKLAKKYIKEDLPDISEMETDCENFSERGSYIFEQIRRYIENKAL